ncbi:MAG: ABC transporter permease [Candidatus Bathyanammoxibius sp.]
MQKTKAPSGYKIEVVKRGPLHLLLRFSGDLSTVNTHLFLADLKRHLSGKLAKKITFDFSGIGYFDSTAAAVVAQEKANVERTGLSHVTFTNVKPKIQGLFGVLNLDSLLKHRPRIKERRPGLFLQVGDAGVKFSKDVVFVLEYLGDLGIGLGYAISHPSKIRWNEVLLYIERVGIDAIPIVLLISFLVGLIMAFQAAIQLKQFGADIYVADLVGLSVVRELGPLMTAIIVAGRTGAAFAAEIGTMKVAEEIDAIKTMGLDPTRFIIIPKVIATVLTVPTLTLMADVLGIFGGMVVAVLFLDLTAWGYIIEMEWALSVTDVLTGYIKSFVFALIIACTGCMRGMQVEGGAQGVGLMTTSAVVTSIFLIVISDALFSLMFNYVGW